MLKFIQGFAVGFLMVFLTAFGMRRDITGDEEGPLLLAAAVFMGFWMGLAFWLSGRAAKRD